MFEKQIFQNKIALIVGNNISLDIFLAKTFLKHGARVWVLGQDKNELAEQVESLSKYGPCDFLLLNSCKSETYQKHITTIYQTDGKVDILINNLFTYCRTISQSAENFNQAIYKSFFLPQHTGSLINILPPDYKQLEPQTEYSTQANNLKISPSTSPEEIAWLCLCLTSPMASNICRQDFSFKQQHGNEKLIMKN